MKPKEIVQAVFPETEINSYGLPGARYWIVRRRGHYDLAEGRTPTEAWKEAATKVLKMAKDSLFRQLSLIATNVE